MIGYFFFFLTKMRASHRDQGTSQSKMSFFSFLEDTPHRPRHINLIFNLLNNTRDSIIDIVRILRI